METQLKTFEVRIKLGMQEKPDEAAIIGIMGENGFALVHGKASRITIYRYSGESNIEAVCALADGVISQVQKRYSITIHEQGTRRSMVVLK